VPDLTDNKEAGEFRFVVSEAQVRAASRFTLLLCSTRVMRGMMWTEPEIKPVLSDVKDCAKAGPLYSGETKRGSGGHSKLISSGSLEDKMVAG
jgi:hypothetical protein